MERSVDLGKWLAYDSQLVMVLERAYIKNSVGSRSVGGWGCVADVDSDATGEANTDTQCACLPACLFSVPTPQLWLTLFLLSSQAAEIELSKLVVNGSV